MFAEIGGARLLQGRVIIVIARPRDVRVATHGPRYSRRLRGEAGRTLRHGPIAGRQSNEAKAPLLPIFCSRRVASMFGPDLEDSLPLARCACQGRPRFLAAIVRARP